RAELVSRRAGLLPDLRLGELPISRRRAAAPLWLDPCWLAGYGDGRALLQPPAPAGGVLRRPEPGSDGSGPLRSARSVRVLRPERSGDLRRARQVLVPAAAVLRVHPVVLRHRAVAAAVAAAGHRQRELRAPRVRLGRGSLRRCGPARPAGSGAVPGRRRDPPRDPLPAALIRRGGARALRALGAADA